MVYQAELNGKEGTTKGSFQQEITSLGVLCILFQFSVFFFLFDFYLRTGSCSLDEKKLQMILEDAYENYQITYVANHCLSVTTARVNGLVVFEVEIPMAEEQEFLGDKQQSKYDEILLVKLIWVDTLGDILGRSTCQPRVLIQRVFSTLFKRFDSLFDKKCCVTQPFTHRPPLCSFYSFSIICFRVPLPTQALS